MTIKNKVKRCASFASLFSFKYPETLNSSKSLSSQNRGEVVSKTKIPCMFMNVSKNRFLKEQKGLDIMTKKTATS